MAYLPLSTANLPDPVIDPAQDMEPRDYFETFLYTGNGTGLQVGDVIKKPADTTTISSSLIFNNPAFNNGQYCTRTNATADDYTTYTFSCWFKRGNTNNTTDIGLISSGSYSSPYEQLYLTSSGEVVLRNDGGGSNNGVHSSDRTIKDNDWHHIVVSRSGTAVAMYLDGVATGTLDTAFSASVFTLNDSGAGQRLGSTERDRYDWDGYMAEVHFIDGTVYDHEDFGNFDANGIWIPKAVSGITYGTNGFYLDFSDNTSTTTLGEDQTANGNDWTLNNFATTDQVADSPTNNCLTFGTRHPVVNGSVTLSEGNLVSLDAGTTYGLHSFTEVGFTTGKYYWEIEATDVNAYAQIGVYNLGNSIPNSAYGCIGYVQTGYSTDFEFSSGWAGTGNVAGSGATYTDGDVIGVALNMDDQEITFYKNGVEQFTKTWSTPNIKFAPAVGDGQNATTAKFTANFGQRDFAHTVPTGFVAPTENNITVDDQNLESPDLVWIQSRGAARHSGVFDSLRGVRKLLQATSSDAESTSIGGVVDFNKNGFTLGAQDPSWYYNEAGVNEVAWCWKAGGATGVVNNAGTIPSTVSANTTSGFSIVSFSAQASAGTVGHGLSNTPEFIILKDLDSALLWLVYHTSTGIDGYLRLDTTAAFTSNTTTFSDAPTNQVFSPGTGVITGNGYGSMIAYCFHSVEGFSKFGKYIGGSDPFVYLGFAPAFVMCKSTGAYHWLIFDHKRDINLNDTSLQADSPYQETTNYGGMDFLSNGFKINSTNAALDSGTITYIAFAENPFKYSLAR